MGDRQTVVERLLKIQSGIIAVGFGIGISIAGWYVNEQSKINEKLTEKVENNTVKTSTLEANYNNHINYLHKK